MDIGPFTKVPNDVSPEHPLRVLIAGGGVGGLALAQSLAQHPAMKVTVLERTESFKRFGGPIQLASNALQIMKEMDVQLFEQVMDKFTFTGDKENGIKDGIRNDWYAKFDLKRYVLSETWVSESLRMFSVSYEVWRKYQQDCA